MNKIPVITLCGSSKFKDVFEEVNQQLTMNGFVVISLGMFAHAKGIKLTNEQVEMLKKIHFQKIDMSDAIFVVDVDRYIGESTKLEIDYAVKHKKDVIYYSMNKDSIDDIILEQEFYV